MANIKKPENKKRVSKGSTVDPKLWEGLKRYSESSGIPVSRLLDKAISDFLEIGRTKK